MTTNDPRSTDVGALLTAWFDVDAPTREPEGLVDAALARTARTRPLPAWRLPERWIPMQLTMRRATIANAVPILVVLALLIALAIGLLLAGLGRPGPSLPLPDGLAANGRLVYVAGGNLVSANDSGTDVRPLVDSDRVVGEPVWSHDGTRFAFKAYTDPASSRQASVIVADADGSHQVTIAADVWDASVPSWSRDDRNLLFGYSPNGTDLSERLYVAPADGSAPPARLAHDPGFAVGASFSPDGTLIAYETGTFEGGQALWLARPDGSEARRLTTGRYYDIGSAEQGSHGFHWKPDSSAILFAAGDDRAHDLYVIDIAPGSQDRPIATSSLHEFGATYAPDGGAISYMVAPRFELATLMIAGGDGSDAHPAIDVGTQTFAWRAPRWSPDARFVTATTGTTTEVTQHEVWIIDVASRAIHAKIAVPPFGAAINGEEGPGGTDVVGFQRVAP
jgi:Tol biopolymer transport system component